MRAVIQPRVAIRNCE